MLQKILLFGLIALTACQSTQLKKKIAENNFSQNFASLPPEEQKILIENPLDFLLWTLKVEAQSEWVRKPVSLDAEWPLLPLHGSPRADEALVFPPEHPGPRYRIFYRLENTFEGPLTWDLFVAETTAEFLAQYLRLNDYPSESCLRAYSESLLSQLKRQSPRGPHFESNAAWQALGPTAENNLPPANLPAPSEAILAPLRKKFGKNWTVWREELAPFNEARQRVRILLDEDKKIWRLAPLAPGTKCSALGRVVKSYGTGGTLHCLQIPAEGAFLLEKFPENTQALSLLHFANGRELQKAQQEICRELARAHNDFLDNSELKKVYWIMAKHPTWQSRWAEKARRHAEAAINAYRLSLSKQ
jgi:hypothetical protein